MMARGFLTPVIGVFLPEPTAAGADPPSIVAVPTVSDDEGMGSTESSFDRVSSLSSSGGGVVGFPLRRFCSRSGNTPTEFARLPRRGDSPLEASRITGFPRRDFQVGAPPLAAADSGGNGTPGHSAAHYSDGDGGGMGPRQVSTVTVVSTGSDCAPAEPASEQNSLHFLHAHAHTERFAADGPDDLIASLHKLVAGPDKADEGPPAPWDFVRTMSDESELTRVCQRGGRHSSSPREFVNGILAASRLWMMENREQNSETPVSAYTGIIAVVTFSPHAFSACSRNGPSRHTHRLIEALNACKTDWFAQDEHTARLLYHLMIGSREHQGRGGYRGHVPITHVSIATQAQLQRPFDRGIDRIAGWVHRHAQPLSPRRSPVSTIPDGTATITADLDGAFSEAVDDIIAYRARTQERLPGRATGCSLPVGITRHRCPPPSLLHRVAAYDVTLLYESVACEQLRELRDDAGAGALHYAACTGDVSWFRTWVFIIFADRHTWTLDPPADIATAMRDGEGRTVLDCAAASGSVPLFMHCLEQWRLWPDLSPDLPNLTRYAAIGGSPDVLRRVLLTRRNGVSSNDELAMLVAHAALGDKYLITVETIRQLCRPTTASYEVMCAALASSATQRTPAHYAARSGSPTALTAACSLQITYDTPDAHGCSIFHHALRSGRIACVETAINLLRNCSGTRMGSWRVWSDDAGNLPIHFAAWSGSAELVDWVSKGGDTSRQHPSRQRGFKHMTTTPSGTTAIHFAARSTNVQLFLDLELEHRAAMRRWAPSQWSLLIDCAVKGGTPKMLGAVVGAAPSSSPLTPRTHADDDAARSKLRQLRLRLSVAAKVNPGYRRTMTQYIDSKDFACLVERYPHVWG